MNNPLPQAGFLRLPQIVGDSKKGIPPLIPISKSTWYDGIKSGKYPEPVKLSERCVAWRVEDIMVLLKLFTPQYEKDENCQLKELLNRFISREMSNDSSDNSSEVVDCGVVILDRLKELENDRK